jgi:hypothetical protein
MATSSIQTNVPLVNEAFVDPQTGRITEAWFIFLIQLWRRTGGSGGTTTGITLDDVFSVEETFGFAAPASVREFLSVEPIYAQGTRQEPLPDMVLAPVTGTSSGGSGTITDQTFSSGTNFTPGTTTTLTLANTFVNGQQLWVYFDGVFQGDDQYSLSGVTLTFTSAIPVGTNKVYVKGLR